MLQRAGEDAAMMVEVLDLDTRQVARIVRLLELWRHGGRDPFAFSPEEVILRAFVHRDLDDESSRRTLVKSLSLLNYTTGRSAPAGGDGYIPGTWDDVVRAASTGLLRVEELEEIRAAVADRASPQ